MMILYPPGREKYSICQKIMMLGFVYKKSSQIIKKSTIRQPITFKVEMDMIPQI